MSSTDDRIVRMQFDNKQFMKGAADTQKALSDTNKAIDGAGKSKGLLDLTSQMNSVAVTATNMQIATTTALATIANKVVNVGLSMASSLTLDPLRQGFSEYESLLTKQNVIMNATGKSAQEVKKFLNELNEYSDKTIYSFGDMTDSITKFVNAGVPLERAVISIQGIANAAAYAGANTQEAGRAMYAFSQSMQTGYIMLNDWMQIENANMGTQQFKQSLIDAAEAAGTLTKQGDHWVTQSGKYVSSTQGWRESLQEQWATTDVLNDALGKYADRTSELGEKAFKSAQDVRTFTAFMTTLKEAIGSGWAQVFTLLIGNLEESTNMWTKLSNVVNGSVGGFFSFVTSALTVWREMGGAEKVMTGFSNIIWVFTSRLHAVGDAWEAAFPNSSLSFGKILYWLSAGFELLTRPLAVLSQATEDLTPAITVFFIAIREGVGFVIGLAAGIVNLTKAAVGLARADAPNAGGLIGFLQSIAEYADGAISSIQTLMDKAKSLGSSLTGFELPGVSVPTGSDVGSAASGASDAAVSEAKSAASTLKSVASGIWSVLVKIGDGFVWLWDTVSGFFENLTATDLVKAFNQAIFATMAYEAIRFVHSMRQGFTGVSDILSGVGDSLTDFATAAKRNATAKLILNLAIALGLLAIALWVLSKIPTKSLFTSLAAITVLTVLMNKSLGAFGDVIDKMDGLGTVLKTIALSVAMIALAAAMMILSVALLIMNKVKWESIAKGLVVMFAMMKLLERIGDMGEDAAKNLIAGAAAIAITAGALIVLAGALLLFKLVDWESMGKAGAALTGVTAAVGALALIPYEGIAKVGLAMLATSVGMVALAGALILFALVKWESIGKAAVMLGLLALAVGGILAVSGGGAGAGVILALSAAMVALAIACMMFEHVDWESIGKAAVVLGVLVLAVAGMAAILAAFLYVVAPVAPVLMVLAGGFALLGLGLLAFSAAMAIAMNLAALGTAAFVAMATGAAVAVGVFFQVLAQQAPVMRESTVKILGEMIKGIVESVPMIIDGFQQLWAAIMVELQDGDKKKTFGDIVEEWLDKMSAAVRRYIPKLVKLGIDIILAFLEGINARMDKITRVSGDLIENFIEGVGDNMGDITATAVDVVIKFANGLEDNAFRLTNAGIDLVAEFLHDLATAIRTGSSKINAGLMDVADAMRDVGVQMVTGLISGVSSQIGDATSVIGNLAQSMVDRARNVLEVRSPSRVFMEIGKFLVGGLTAGIQSNAASAIVAVASMITGAIAVADDYVSSYLQKLDQQAIAARAKAQGLAEAARRAQESANKTKTKEDDRAARKLAKQAKAAAKLADKEEKQAEKARRVQAEKERWEKAGNAERAEIRANQAQTQLSKAKEAEKAAEAARTQAAALRAQAKKAGSEKERKALIKAADKAQQEAREQALRANQLLEAARGSSIEAIKYQKLAGAEAAEAYQKLFEAEAKSDKDAKAFDRLSAEEKAAERRKQATELQALADQHLAKAKKLAYTDLERANALAQQALEEAEQARKLRDEADGYLNNGLPGSPGGQVVDIYQTEEAAAAFNRYSDLYDSAYAAAAVGPTFEFNQYNTSPEALSDIEIYRQTNNQLNFATDKLAEAAA